MGVRMYDYTLGAWNQKDPSGYPDGMDTYEFVMSHPTNWVDPSEARRGFGINWHHLPRLERRLRRGGRRQHEGGIL